MFHFQQPRDRNDPLYQIWLAATMHERIDRSRLDELNIIEICRKIFEQSAPMSLGHSGILMCGAVIVSLWKLERLEDDVGDLIMKIEAELYDEAVSDPTVRLKGRAKRK